jgi:hypothetical protein
MDKNNDLTSLIADLLKEYSVLKMLEDELIELIANTDEEKLMDKFLDWQCKRNDCNESFKAILKRSNDI